MKITREDVASIDDIREAIKLRSSECFGAMNIVHALHRGEETNAWWLIHHYTLDELRQALKEAQE